MKYRVIQNFTLRELIRTGPRDSDGFNRLVVEWVRTGAAIGQRFEFIASGSLAHRFLEEHPTVGKYLIEKGFIEAVEPELKPCPFCGEKASFGTIEYSHGGEISRLNGQSLFHLVNCPGCGVKNTGLVGHKTKCGAAEAWNRRA